jgi:hypothetical protein
MKHTNNFIKTSVFFLLAVCVGFLIWNCSGTKAPVHDKTVVLSTNPNETGSKLIVSFVPGAEHNHPLMAIWVSDTMNNYLQTIYVAESIAKGVFKHGEANRGKWEPGPLRRPAALPYWAHNRGVKASDGLYIPEPSNPMPDAVSGATPPANFIVESKLKAEMPHSIFVYFEINQSWDWNEYWTNSKYPDDDEYKTSCQPALVYRALLNTRVTKITTKFQLVGHSSFNGSDGSLFTNLETITSAKEITSRIEAYIEE